MENNKSVPVINEDIWVKNLTLIFTFVFVFTISFCLKLCQNKLNPKNFKMSPMNRHRFLKYKK